MGVGYKVVQWNRHKKIYDLAVILGVILFLLAYIWLGGTIWAKPDPVSMPILPMRALGVCAFVMLNIILMIGPLARLNPKFLPLLYNRRHFGVLTFFVALFHFLLALVWYYSFSDVNTFAALFTTNEQLGNVQAFPFELFGILALLVLFVMAATSHDFWLKNLSPPVWKALHMGVYLAYGALILHIALGYMQSDRGWTAPILLALSITVVAGLHIAAALKDARDSRPALSHPRKKDAWVDVAAPADIPEDRAFRINVKGGQRIALFKYDGKLSAVSALCAHQNGPLDEGRIVDGCITCPWHGYQYDPATGRSPPPFTEKIPTYRVKVEDGRIWVNPTPLPPGTPVDPAPLPS